MFLIWNYVKKRFSALRLIYDCVKVEVKGDRWALKIAIYTEPVGNGQDFGFVQKGKLQGLYL